MYARVKSIMSPDFDFCSPPEDPENCCDLIEVEIGPFESEGAEFFSFKVVTPSAVKSLPAPSWLRGYLLLPEFSWAGAEEAVNKLVSQCTGSDWGRLMANKCRQGTLLTSRPCCWRYVCSHPITEIVLLDAKR